MLTLFNERFGHRADRGDAAIQPEGRVDTVGQQVARHATSGSGGVQTPQGGTPLGQVGRNRPVLQEVGSIVKDLPQLAGVDNLLGESDRRGASVVVPDGVRDACLLDSRRHFFAFGRIHRQRLFAQDHLASGRGRQGNFTVQVVGRADIDSIDIFACDQLAPVSLDRFVTPGVSEFLAFGLIASTDGFQNRAIFEIKKVVNFAVSVRVGPAHEAVTHESNIERFRHACRPSVGGYSISVNHHRL